jgi:hypothetical protein
MSREIVPALRIAQSIYWLRGQKVMLDFDLAALYGVATKVLNQAMKRNQERFPADFMFQLTAEETSNFRSQFVTSRSQTIGNQSIPMNRSQFVTLKRGQNINLPRKFAELEQGVGERTRLACWRWRPRYRELLLRCTTFPFGIRSSNRFPARRQKGHARRVCSPIRMR